MLDFKSLTKDELINLKTELQKEYDAIAAKKLSLDMSRGKPAASQLDLSNGILNSIKSYITEEGIDARNYGILCGLKETKRLFSDLLGIPSSKIIIGGNSSLNLIYDSIARLYIFGALGSKPWGKLDKVKIICPCPGYDRHFAILEEFGFEMISVKLTPDGPDMDEVERIAAEDEAVKGILCVPLYSNPDGTCYSDETVERIAKMKTVAEDFKIFWDNAYGVHHIYKERKLKDIFAACEKYSNEDRVLYFFSTSKITFPGSGVALLAASERYVEEIKMRLGIQTIGYNKLNQLSTISFFKNADGIREHMKKLADLLRPKFDIVLTKFEKEFSENNLLRWTKPDGGYFISVNTIDGCAKDVVKLAKEAGVVLTEAGATYPYGNDPHDSNIRIAPSYPNKEELKEAVDVFCVCVKLASVNKILSQK